MDLLEQNKAEKSHVFMRRYVLIDETNNIFHVIKEETVLSDEHIWVSETFPRLIDKINAREGIDGLIRNGGRPSNVNEPYIGMHYDKFLEFPMLHTMERMNFKDNVFDYIFYTEGGRYKSEDCHYLSLHGKVYREVSWNPQKEPHVFIRRYVLLDEINELFHVIKDETITIDEDISATKAFLKLVDDINETEGTEALIDDGYSGFFYDKFLKRPLFVAMKGMRVKDNVFDCIFDTDKVTDKGKGWHYLGINGKAYMDGLWDPGTVVYKE